jgi:hypothetical protein
MAVLRFFRQRNRRATTEMNASMAIDVTAYFKQRQSAAEMPWRNPAQAYADFLAAIGKRDVDAVIARMTDTYAHRLSVGRARRGFERDFASWCEKYPRDLKVTACRIDGSSATLETAAHGLHGTLAGRVTMVLNGGIWCVGAERWVDDREDPRVARLSACPA